MARPVTNSLYMYNRSIVDNVRVVQLRRVELSSNWTLTGHWEVTIAVRQWMLQLVSNGRLACSYVKRTSYVSRSRGRFAERILITITAHGLQLMFYCPSVGESIHWSKAIHWEASEKKYGKTKWKFEICSTHCRHFICWFIAEIIRQHLWL